MQLKDLAKYQEKKQRKGRDDIMMTVQQIRERCIEIFAADGKEFKNIEVAINGRLKATLGRCSYKAVCGVVIPTKIEISRHLLESGNTKEIDNTIVHECAHALVTLDTKERHGHDNLFVAKCQKYGIAGNRCAEGSRLDNPTEYKYTVFCKGCGKPVGCYFRAGQVVKNPSMYHSRCCGATLRIVQNY